MNIIEAYNAGQQGANYGLPMGDGLEPISRVINGVQRARIYTVAAAPKGGKSTLVDIGFVLEPCLYVLEFNFMIQEQMAEIKKRLDEEVLVADERKSLNIQYETLSAKLFDFEIIYNSYEIDRVSKEFDFMAHFLHRDYGIEYIQLPAGKTCKGSNVILLSSSYLRGELQYDVPLGYRGEREIVKVDDNILTKMIDVYNRRIIPLFGEFDSNGNQLRKGLIIFLEYRENPTGIRNYLIDYAKKHGEFLYSTFQKDGVEHKKIIGYKPLNPKKFTLVVTDHLRKIASERGFNLKQTVDKFSEYAVELRNYCSFSFVHIIHLNRSLNDPNRLKFDEDRLFPKSDDIKETGNLSEDSNYVFTMFDPNDDRYKLLKHFDLVIRTPAPGSRLLYPNMRTIHLVESRHCVFPQHFRVNLHGETKRFTQFQEIK